MASKRLEKMRALRLDKDETLMRFTDREITVMAWCESHGFGRSSFYEFLDGTIRFQRRTCITALKIYAALKKEGLLVLAESDHSDQNISCSPLSKLEQNGDL